MRQKKDSPDVVVVVLVDGFHDEFQNFDVAGYR